jgi:hypothetical protein
LALKAGEWFRRGLLLIASPVQQPLWLLSGRNSTYPAVQISRASSYIGSLDPQTGEVIEYPMPDANVRDPHSLTFD